MSRHTHIFGLKRETLSTTVKYGVRPGNLVLNAPVNIYADHHLPLEQTRVKLYEGTTHGEGKNLT